MRLLSPALIPAFVLVATLGGCFLLPLEADEPPMPETTIAAELADPEVGDCWTTEDYNWGEWISWRGDAAVDCDDDHESYTYAVSDVLETFDAIYKSNGYVLAETNEAAWDSCYDALEQFMGAPIADSARMTVTYFLPSKTEWKEGARWLRCDLLVFQLGSSVFERKFAELPDDASELVEALEKNADYFDFCIDTADGFTGYGPFFSESAVYSNCAKDPMWRLDGYTVIPDEYNAKYPGDEAVAQLAHEGCLADMEPSQWGYAHYPDEDTWFTGDRLISCWAYEWDVPVEYGSPV